MSVTIRLSKTGKKHAPTYKIVVANTRDKRNGKALDILGYYNPAAQQKAFQIDKEKYEEWKEKGAMTTKAVEDLITGNYEFAKYEPKAQVKKERADKKEEAPEETEHSEEKEAEATEETPEVAEE